MEFSPYGFGMTDAMFDIVPVFMIIAAVIVIGVFIVRLFQGTAEWISNNESPVLTVEANVVTKRTNVYDRYSSSYNSTSTDYFVTFEITGGDRVEFKVSGRDYGMLVEGDIGKLTFQGTRYLGFERDRS